MKSYIKVLVGADMQLHADIDAVLSPKSGRLGDLVSLSSALRQYGDRHKYPSIELPYICPVSIGEILDKVERQDGQF